MGADRSTVTVTEGESARLGARATKKAKSKHTGFIRFVSDKVGNEPGSVAYGGYLMLPKWACSGMEGSSNNWMIVAGPKLVGSVQERKAHAIFLSGVISQA